MNFRLAISFFSMLTALHLVGQDETLTITARVIDSDSKIEIPYAHVYINNKQKGTVTDLDGFFTIEGAYADDTIFISFVGYARKQVYAKELIGVNEVEIKPLIETLNEIQLINNDDYLYELIARCKKGVYKKERTAKSYFSLNSYIDKQQVELLECYYNGVYNGVDIKALNLKNGRISLENNRGRYFVSISTSKAVLSHKLFVKNEYFPSSPFQYTEGKLRKKYFLHLDSKLKEGKQATYVIKFTPKGENATFFYGKAWIDSATAKPIKLILKNDSTTLNPFLALFPEYKLEKVSLEITKNFSLKQDTIIPKSVDFKYAFKYVGRNEMISVKTNAVLYSYDYEHKFELPYYGVNQDYLSDYRKIIAAPYNTYFWNNISEFKTGELVERNRQFVKNTILINNPIALSPTNQIKNGFFEQSYIQWNSRRMLIKDKLPEGVTYESLSSVLPSKRYFLKAHLYMDINQLNGSINILTRAIYDPYRSYYHYPDSKVGDAFINMFFDLYEIQRRALEENLNNKKTTESNAALYSHYNAKAEEKARKYIKDVLHGEDLDAMKKWNLYILNNLELNNLQYYGLD